MSDAIALAKSRSDCHPSNVDTLVHLVNELGDVPGSIVEIGSYRCGATIALAAADPNKHVYAFDLFGGLPYRDAGFENFQDANFVEIQEITASFPNITLIRGLHEETIPAFSDQPLSLIFMDSDHYSSHKVCLDRLWPMLSSGGVAVFHDWSFPGVQRAICETIPENEKKRYGCFEGESRNMGRIVKA